MRTQAVGAGYRATPLRAATCTSRTMLPRPLMRPVVLKRVRVRVPALVRLVMLLLLLLLLLVLVQVLVQALVQVLVEEQRKARYGRRQGATTPTTRRKWCQCECPPIRP